MIHIDIDELIHDVLGDTEDVSGPVYRERIKNVYVCRNLYSELF